MPPEQVLCEFISGVAIAENARVIETLPEFTDDRVCLIFDIQELRLYERHGRLQHRAIGKLVGLREGFAFEMELGFEDEPLGIREVELRD